MTLEGSSNEGVNHSSLERPDPLRGRLADQVYVELRAAICDFRIPPNKRLVQNDLAEELKISRTPVRDALIQLSQEGLIRTLPARGGFVVTEFTAREVLDIYEVRLALEPIAARQAAGKHGLTALAELRQVNQELADDPGLVRSDQYELNRRFHEIVIGPCRNAILKSTLARLWSMPSSLRMYNRLAGSQSIESIVTEHEGIIEALTRGDSNEVFALVAAHIDGARDQALEQLGVAGD
jgi:DNA-binding GntR family transcriptional regulator